MPMWVLPGLRKLDPLLEIRRYTGKTRKYDLVAIWLRSEWTPSFRYCKCMDQATGEFTTHSINQPTPLIKPLPHSKAFLTQAPLLPHAKASSSITACNSLSNSTTTPSGESGAASSFSSPLPRTNIPTWFKENVALMGPQFFGGIGNLIFLLRKSQC